jgi:hypothetical protein
MYDRHYSKKAPQPKGGRRATNVSGIMRNNRSQSVSGILTSFNSSPEKENF